VKILPLARAEFARVTSSKMGRLSLAALMTVPLFYGGLYLWGNEDPYDNLDGVPAALVVADGGATVDDDAVNYGQDAADEILDDGTFDWHEVSEADARAGVEDGTYDFALAFPVSFSADLASASGDDPTRASLELTTNDTNSYLSTTVAKQAAAEVRTTLAEQVGERATTELLDSIAEIRDGVVDASDGAAKLADGAEDASAGADDLADGTATLANGADDLSTGTSKLADGAHEAAAGANKLSDGASTLADGTQDLLGGAKKLSAGLGTLDESVSGLPADARTLSDGAAQVSSGVDTAASGADTVADGAGQVAAGVPALRSAVQRSLTAAGVPAASQQPLLSQFDSLASGASSVSGGASQLSSGLDTLSSGASRVATGADTLADNAPALASGIDDAADGASSLYAGAKKVDAGADRLDSGAADLADGTHTLSAGAKDAASGAATLADGAHDAADGASTLADGTDKLSSGATRLSDSLADAQDQIPAQSDKQRESIAKTISNPVAVDQKALAEAANYGAGLAPFFISLGAWIGIYALFLIFRPLSRRALTAVNTPLRTTLAGWLTPAVLGVVQMIALFGILTLALHLPIAHPVGVVLFMAFTSITFAAILLALNALLGSIGQFLGLVLMVIQLVTAGGTFPWQTLPEPLAAVHRVLPMAHAVDGIRQLMYGGTSTAAVWQSILPLALWLLGGLAVTAFAAWKQARFRSLREVRPAAIGG
jgi:putative membrane protein